MDDYPEDTAASSEGENKADITSKPPADEANEGETVLVAKSALGGDCKMGQTYPMKVVGLYDDEVELAHDKGEDKEETSEDDGMGMDSMNSKLDGVAASNES